jgi:hypothetical protein
MIEGTLGYLFRFFTLLDLCSGIKDQFVFLAETVQFRADSIRVRINLTTRVVLTAFCGLETDR